jgi:hypothetical protein
MKDLALSSRIRALRDLSVPSLRQRYQELSGRTTKTDNRPWLVKAVCRHMVAGERVEGRNARRALARALEVAKLPRHRPVDPTARDPRIPPAGSVLRRHYKGEAIEVLVTKTGFRCRGRPYRSLSAIAREVTGNRWNGVLWFGLRSRQRGRRNA